MPTVRELSEPYANFMLTPQAGPGICRLCFNLTDGYHHCYACTRNDRALDQLAPISYSVAHEQLHHSLASYKRLSGGVVGRRLTLQLAAVLWRFLEQHETCLVRGLGIDGFPIVTVVPSGDPMRDEEHPLRWVVADVVSPTRDRHERLLRRSESVVPSHTFALEKYVATRTLAGESVLLIDDTWTTGANAQSAAAALKAAGAGAVAALVIGRHVNRDWHENDRRLRALPPFDWKRCSLCAEAAVQQGSRSYAGVAVRYAQ